ncbi:hypothetical protein ACIQZG_16805 [Lysinibacillus sp. NPDC096418]|uniref:hypothetical protein n=1 Tax=Lysinibacillus sp. NPDC096418 TaxID=3364138 RepID=UPI0038184247
MMIDKVFSSMNSACKKVGELAEISISFPKPSKQSFIISSLTNGMTGIVFILVGIFLSYKWMLALGVLGIAASVITGIQAKR